MEKGNGLIKSLFKGKTNQKDLLFNSEDKLFYSKEDKRVIRRMIYNLQLKAKYRKEYYLRASGAKLSLTNFPNYYNDILTNFPDEIPSFYSEKIKVDLQRTFPTNPQFNHSDGPKKLGNILLAFTRRNPTIGYCQGLNFLAGRSLLITQNEEEAFWLFTHIMEDMLPFNFFKNLSGATIDHNIVLSIVSEKYKDTVDYLRERSYDFYMDNLINKWFLSLFILNINEKLSYLIWDLFMVDKSTLVNAAIVLFKFVVVGIKNVNFESDNAVVELTTIVLCADNEKQFLLLLSQNTLNYTDLKLRRKEEEEKVMPNGKEEVELKEDNCHCNVFWNVCTSNRMIINQPKDYLIHRAYSTPKIYENYFNWKEDMHMSLNMNNNDNYFELLLERIPHKCQSAQKEMKGNNSN